MADFNKNSDKNLDEFWDLDSLMPKKTYRTPVRNSQHTEAVDIVEGSGDSSVNSEFRLTKQPIGTRQTRNSTTEKHNEPEAVYEYDTGLIRTIKVYNWNLLYNCFDQFCRDGEKLLTLRAGPCERQKFFSYIPQYSQLNQSQLLWYLYWRQQVRDGSYPETDYSYVMLYVFELINLTVKENAGTALTMLCRLLVNYGKDNIRLMQYLSEWIPDFCMIYGLPLPVEELGGMFDDMLTLSSFKEFYIGVTDSKNSGAFGVELLSYCSDYKYKNSKFYTGETENLYDRLMCGAVGLVVRLLESKKNVSLFNNAVMKRDAFVGALCSHRIKKRFEISYCSISRTHVLRPFITDTVKHTENRIRAYLGVKSRLTVYCLTDDFLRELDKYIDENLPSKVKPKPKPQEPEYEKLYDIPHTGLSAEHAARIEQASWVTTERLVQAFGDDEELVTDTVEPNMPIEDDNIVMPEKSDTGAFGEFAGFVRLVLDGDFSGELAWAEAHGMMLDSVADRVNEMAADSDIGDVILEECDEGYSLIEDYRNDVAGMI